MQTIEFDWILVDKNDTKILQMIPITIVSSNFPGISSKGPGARNETARPFTANKVNKTPLAGFHLFRYKRIIPIMITA